MRFTGSLLRPLVGLAALALVVSVSATRRDGSGVTSRNAGSRGAASGAPTRIIPGSAAAADWLTDLVAAERIAALPEQIAEFSTLPFQAEGWAGRPRFPNFTTEIVLSYQPDLVLVSPFTDASMVARVRSAGPVVVTVPEATSWEELITTARSLGELLDATEASEALVVELSRRRDALRDRSGARALRVLPYGNFGAGGSTSGEGTTLDLVIELAGYRNAALDAGIVGVDDLSLEVMLGLEFDAVLLGGTPERSSSASALRGEDTLRAVPAVRDERFLFLPTPLHVSGSQTILDAAESLAAQGDALPR